MEKLRSTAFDPADRQVRELRASLYAEPKNLSHACRFASICTDQSRAQADPPYLGRAPAALSTWWDAPKPRIDALVLRVKLRQSQHDFTNALEEFDIATHIAPRNPQVWPTRLTILTALGDYAGARRACLALAQLAPGLIGLSAAANVTSLNGEAERGCGLLRSTLAAYSSARMAEKIWALTVLTKALERLGQGSEAQAEFRNALALGQRDPYLLGAYADLLRDHGRAPEVVDLLKYETRVHGLLLRLDLAESTISPRPTTYADHLATLSARFEAGHLRGDFVHQREEARFAPRLLNQPREALRLAQANWQMPHEPADLRMTLETALAADDPAAALPALDFIHPNHLEDVELTKLAKQMDYK